MRSDQDAFFFILVLEDPEEWLLPTCRESDARGLKEWWQKTSFEQSRCILFFSFNQFSQFKADFTTKLTLCFNDFAYKYKVESKQTME